MKKLLIIDGPAVMHRAWHALPKLTDPQGRIVSAVYGFASLLIKLLREQKPDFLAVALDTKAPTFRHKIYKEYKAKRIKQPQEFYDQFTIMKEVLNAFEIKFIERPGYEADDIIGTLVAKSSQNNLIVTGDLDTLQLIGPQTHVYFLHKGISDLKIYDQTAVEHRFGLKPEQLIDFKALRGDPSDNILGVKGIGEKTALALVQQFGSLEKIYEKIEDNQAEIKDSVKKLLIDQKNHAFVEKKLVEIIKDVPDIKSTDDYQLKFYSIDKVKTALEKLGFNSLIQRLENNNLLQQNQLF